MTIPKWTTTASLVGLLTLGSATIAVQGARPEWKLVPAMPTTSCFSDDGFGGKVGEAQNAVLAAKDQQDALNSKLREQFDKMDMMERAQRMQAWMVKNPQGASKMLEASAGAGQAGAETMAELKASADRLDRELVGHKKAFDAAIAGAVQPVDSKIDALLKTRTRKTQVDAVFISTADYDSYVAALNDRNAAYEKACAPFYGANGSMHRWLQSFRSEITDKAMAAEETGNAAMAQQFAILDTPSGGYRATGGYDLVREYLRRLSDVAGYRASMVKPDPVLKPRFDRSSLGR